MINIEQRNNIVRKMRDRFSLTSSKDNLAENADIKKFHEALDKIDHIASNNGTKEFLYNNFKEKEHWLKWVGIPLLLTFIPMAITFMFLIGYSYHISGRVNGFSLFLSIAVAGSVLVYFSTVSANVVTYLKYVRPQVKDIIELHGLLSHITENGTTISELISSKLIKTHKNAISSKKIELHNGSVIELSGYNYNIISKGVHSLILFHNNKERFSNCFKKGTKLSTGMKIYDCYSIIEAYASISAARGKSNNIFMNEADNMEKFWSRNGRNI